MMFRSRLCTSAFLPFGTRLRRILSASRPRFPIKPLQSCDVVRRPGSGYFSRSKEKGKCISYLIIIIVRIFLLPGKVGLLLTNFLLSQVVRCTGFSLSFCFISLLFLCFVRLFNILVFFTLFLFELKT